MAGRQEGQEGRNSRKQRSNPTGEDLSSDLPQSHNPAFPAFLTGEPRSASLVSLGESEVLELSLSSMDAVVKNHPRVKTVLDRMYHGRVLARVLAESPLFEFMSPGERQRIASKFDLHFVTFYSFGFLI